jgi:hypothetical protein
MEARTKRVRDNVQRNNQLKPPSTSTVNRTLPHSAAFTLATYVHLLDGDLGEPLAILQNVGNDAE